jgi:hypothetical protein
MYAHEESLPPETLRVRKVVACRKRVKEKRGSPGALMAAAVQEAGQ